MLEEIGGWARPPLVEGSVGVWPIQRLIRRLILDAQQVGEVLDDDTCRVEVIGEKVVARPMSAWPPDVGHAVGQQMIAHALQIRPALDLPGVVMQPVGTAHDVERMVIGAAAHPDDVTPDAVGEAKS